jgi:hypothetical protein
MRFRVWVTFRAASQAEVVFPMAAIMFETAPRVACIEVYTRPTENSSQMARRRETPAPRNKSRCPRTGHFH